MDKRKSHNGGFTLVEVVISTVLIGLLAIGFTQLISGSMRAIKAGYDYDASRYELGKAIETDIYADGMTEKANGEVSIHLSNLNDSGDPETYPSGDYDIVLDEYIIYYDDSPQNANKGTLKYYR